MPNSLHSEYDAIGEALDDAICNGDGRPTAKHLLIELAHRGLKIIPVHDAGACDAMIRAVATRIAKRAHGEDYAGYESTHAEAAADYVGAIIEAAGVSDLLKALEESRSWIALASRDYPDALSCRILSVIDTAIARTTHLIT